MHATSKVGWVTFSAAAAADSSSIQDIDGSDFLKVSTISVQNKLETRN
jgi:hypothetical protein